MASRRGSKAAAAAGPVDRRHVPRELLRKLCQRAWADDGQTKVKDAVLDVFGKLIDIYVGEIVYRCAKHAEETHAAAASAAADAAPAAAAAASSSAAASAAPGAAAGRRSDHNRLLLTPQHLEAVLPQLLLDF